MKPINELVLPEDSSVGELQDFLVDLDALEEEIDKRSKDYKLYKDLWNNGVDKYHKLVGYKVFNKK